MLRGYGVYIGMALLLNECVNHVLEREGVQNRRHRDAEAKRLVSDAHSSSALEEDPILLEYDSVASHDDDVDKALCCPITQAMMVDPVITANGQTYERAAIQAWFDSGHMTDPMTGIHLESGTLISNYAIKRIITEYKQKAATATASAVSSTAATAVSFSSAAAESKPVARHVVTEVKSQSRPLGNGMLTVLEPLIQYASARGLFLYTRHHVDEANILIQSSKATLMQMDRAGDSHLLRDLLQELEAASNRVAQTGGGYYAALSAVIKNIKTAYASLLDELQPGLPAPRG